MFIEPSHREFETPLKIGNLFTNRFAIDEDASSEIVKIVELDKKSTAVSWKEYQNDLYYKGMNLIIEI